MASKKGQSGDDRFQKVKKDPRFWEMPEKEHKIKIDKRFQSMFHDDRFKLKYTVDKRGRPVNHTTSEDLKRFYNLSDSEEEKEDGKDKEEKKKKKKTKAKLDSGEGEEKVVDEPKKPLKKEKASQSIKSGPKGDQPIRGVRLCEEGEEDDKVPHVEGDGDYVDLAASISDGSEEDEDEDEDEEADVESDVESGSEDESGSESDEDSDGSGPDLARGKGNVETSSDEDGDDDVEAVLKREEEEIQHDWGELCKDAPRSEEVTQRLAVCNMDWDRMKAKDLLALFNSFKPKGGVVLSVKIYPSEFGKERIQQEQTQGPLELMALPEDPDKDTEEEKIYREKMRDYQFKRLKYYYAVVECDSLDTAAKIYQECDGFEYESSCSILDLRFVPDDVTFDEEPKDLATDVDLSAYTPKLFTSTAAATSKVEVTWDETDHERVTAMNRKFNKDELLQMDFNAYLASSSDDEDGVEMETVQEKEEELPEVKQPGEEKKARKGKQSSGKQIEKYREMLKSIQEKDKKKEDKGMEMEITWVPGLKETTEQLVKKKLEGKDKLTPWEEFIEKKKDKKKQKKTKGKQESDDSDLSDDELPPDVDFDDPFFAEELGSTDLKKKAKSKKNRKVEERTPEEEEELEKQKAEMALLMDDQDDDKHKHFNYDKIVEEQNLSKKKKKKLLKKDNTSLEEDDFQVDVKDPRFQAMFTSHLYNLDPSDPGYKKTKATQSIQVEKQRRREERQRDQDKALKSSQAPPTQEVGEKKQETDASGQAVAEPTKKMDPGLSMLIKSIKNKTEQFQARKKQKTM
ncbi:ESF1 homolog [Coregonus clupeaformis]|uniref:ESF1 homolog n=1 Tax=Coregonus clupeaformis TaxID=59861 RepID=UPI001E1C2637|nr:ESF1 homolog [Coregonus clupeaformis]